MYNIGVIVLNYNKYEMTQSCVDNLLKINSPCRIVIVDNASPNESFSVLSEIYSNVENVDVIKNGSNAGYAAGNNVGIRFIQENYSSVEYICIMNPDVRITYGEIFIHLADILSREKDVAAVTGMMITRGIYDASSCYWNIPRGRQVAWGHSVLAKRKMSPLHCDEFGVARVEVIPGSFFMIKKSVLQQIGGFDEGTFLYNEENILATEIKRMGMCNTVSVNNYYFHDHVKKPRMKWIDKLKNRKVGNQSRRYLCNKYYSKVDRMWLEVVIVLNYIIISILHFGGNIVRCLRGTTNESKN